MRLSMLFLLLLLPAFANADQAGVVDAYLRIAEVLAQDKTDGVSAQAEAIAASAGEAPVQKAAGALAVAEGGLAGKRSAFKKLSAALIKALGGGKIEGVRGPLYLVHCPMTAEGNWLQRTKKVRNPYFGSEMLECGVVKKTLVEKQHSSATSANPGG